MKPSYSASLLTLALASTAAAQSACPDWTDPHTATVSASPSDLADKLSKAASGTTLLLEPGTYRISAALRIAKDDITLRSRTGRRGDVILDGDASGAGKVSGFTPEVIAVSASGAVIADVTVRHARDHAIHAYPPAGKPIARLRLRGLDISDCGQQLVKVNSNGGSPPQWADSGLVECSRIGFNDNSVMEPSGSGFYTGGIDIHGGRGWIIRGNLFHGIERQGKAMEHAVHLWSKSRDCVVEANRFENVYRAIGLGMKTRGDALERHYPDGKGDAPYLDFIGGSVRNNVVWNRAGIHLESGIEIMNAQDAQVVHNTVWSAEAPFSSLEYRWPDTRILLANNLSSHAIKPRDQAQAEAKGNLADAPAELFRDAAEGDLRLAAPGTSGAQAVDRGAPLAAGAASLDHDGEARDSLPDIGADEYRSGGAAVRKGLAWGKPREDAGRWRLDGKRLKRKSPSGSHGRAPYAAGATR